MRGNKHKWEDQWVFAEAANISSSHSSLTMCPVDSTNGAVNGADLFNWGEAQTTDNFSWTQLSHKGLYTVDLRRLGLCLCVCVCVRRYVWQILMCLFPYPLLTVCPLWVPKCSSGAALCIVHQKPLQRHGRHTSGAAIVAVHSRGAGTFSHWDVWEHEAKLRSVF